MNEPVVRRGREAVSRCGFVPFARLPVYWNGYRYGVDCRLTTHCLLRLTSAQPGVAHLWSLFEILLVL